MPHKAVRGSPVTDLRQNSPATAMATATVAPAGTATRLPFTTTATVSGMNLLTDRP